MWTSGLSPCLELRLAIWAHPGPRLRAEPHFSMCPTGTGVWGLPDICHACAWALGVHTHLGEPVYVKPHDTLDCAWLPGTLTHTQHRAPSQGMWTPLSVSVCQSRCYQDSP